jgi:UDP-N-acetylglucosamine diphosphorylase / glucose-1-phosphate thymidylyltransferase / UDP-N-acetylgalactosamine diphosphorylase / glucosamine-1-phosphate N-acetyltransferase / galactosamine-1-phosphate N-acetyltransferase
MLKNLVNSERQSELLLAFFANDHSLTPLLQGAECNECPAAYLEITGKPLIVHNIDVANRALKGKVTNVAIPHKFKSAIEIVKAHYRSVNVIELNDHDGSNGLDFTKDSSATNVSSGSFQLPINSIVKSSSSSPTGSDADNTSNLTVDLITYPWDFLAAIQDLLRETITTTYISPTAKVSKTCIIEGPCIIEDNVVLDDFCKIKGPAYIGEGSLVGMCSLVRGSMLGKNTRIGFNCEIAKSFFSGDAKISHQNVILDSVIGKHVWFGGYSATTNVLLTRRNVKYQIDGILRDTGTDHFGAVVGNNSSIGANVLILPGRQIPPNSMIQAGTIVRN